MTNNPERERLSAVVEAWLYEPSPSGRINYGKLLDAILAAGFRLSPPVADDREVARAVIAAHMSDAEGWPAIERRIAAALTAAREAARAPLLREIGELKQAAEVEAREGDKARARAASAEAALKTMREALTVALDIDDYDALRAALGDQP